ncbi:hypothetical protein Dda_7699 [Drechslerella dactyloides]|uniref:Meiotically up-regulated 65 protein n=1 Tax=Drechslerella dactyloides TaxID=74499 RepID=A0AAD6ISN6_DREDA|nr:hypothetical protein Dda_7699 [Drechslerella dactyloides]
MASSLRRFSINLASSQKHPSEPEPDHFIVLKDNTVPSAPPTNRDSLARDTTRDSILSDHRTSSSFPYRDSYGGAALSRATTSNLSSVSENGSPAPSATASRAQSVASFSEGLDSPVNVRTSGHFSSAAGPSSSAGHIAGHKRKDSLRKHLAERKYQRQWKQPMNNINSGEMSGKSSSSTSEVDTSDDDYDSDPNGGRKSKRLDKEKDRIKGLPTAVLSKQDEIRYKGARALRKARQVGRRVRKEELVDDAGELDILYENQRGTFLFGIPMFSAKSLLPVDSAPWTNRHHAPSAVNIFTAQVPDPSWVWAWKSFAVDMTGDVDEEGWQYSFAFRGSKWHGNAVWWHGFVRRRRWIRKRVKRRLPDGVDDAHNLTPEYFTIHSRHASVLTEPSGYYSSSIRSLERNSKLEEYPTATHESEDSELEDVEIHDIPALMRAFKRARLDREKIEALTSFLDHGGAEVIYLADSIPRIMRSMIFQQSRRQLLHVLLDTLNRVNKKRQDRIKPAEAPNGKAATPATTPDEEDFDDDDEKRYIDGLGRAVDAGEEEVRKLEYWSDIKKAQQEGYVGVEHTHDHAAHPKIHISPPPRRRVGDGDESDYEYANIWRARGKIAKQRKEQIAGKARGEFAERDGSDRSSLGSDGGTITARDKGKGRATA